jgi:hypothetical protein
MSEGNEGHPVLFAWKCTPNDFADKVIKLSILDQFASKQGLLVESCEVHMYFMMIVSKHRNAESQHHMDGVSSIWYVVAPEMC